MTGRYKAYSEYKDSGVEWLGDIPANWTATRHKFIASFTKGRNPSTLLDKQQEGMLPYLSMDYLRGKELPKFSFIDSGSYATKLKQILLIWDGSNAGEFIIGKEGILSSTMAASELISEINIGFYWYLCTCIEPEMRKHATGMGIPHVNGQELRDSVFPLPKPEEQQKIANFLDHETAKIDTLITKQEKLIELLKEKRQAVISHAVTEGLNPDAPMKDTGVEWLEKIPKHWSRTKLGFECSVKARLGWKGLKADEYIPEGYIFLATPNIKSLEIDFKNVNYITKQRYEESPEIMLEVNDLLVTKDGSTTGTTNLVRDLPAPATVNSSIAVIRPRTNLNPEYLYYYFVSTYTQNVIKRVQGGMGVPHLFQADLRWFNIILPPQSEQIKIAAYLNDKTKKCDRLIKQAQEAIKLMQERKAALISSAVTGKIDVREWQGE